MRVLVDGLHAVIEGDVVDGKLLDCVAGEFGLDAESIVRSDDGACFQIHGWLVEVEVLVPASMRGM